MNFKIGCLTFLLLPVILIVTFFMFSSGNNGQTPFEVITKKGKVELHLGMSKDSVIMFVGEPDRYRSHSIGKRIIEKLEYEGKDGGFADLSFNFEDGLLESYSQY